jgi:hypothetical protein
MAREPCTIELYSGTVRLDAVRDRLRKQLGRLSRAPEQGGGELEDGAEALRRRRARCRPRLARSRWARACGPAGPQRPVLFLSRMATHPSRWDRLLYAPTASPPRLGFAPPESGPAQGHSVLLSWRRAKPAGWRARASLGSTPPAHRSRLPSLPRGRAPPAGALRPPSRNRTPRKPQHLSRILHPLRASCFTTARLRVRPTRLVP